MIYPDVRPALFLARPNRFIAEIELGGVRQRCHVKNTGRLGELLLPGAEIWVQCFDSPTRRTACDLITVRKGAELVNVDSQAPNRVFSEWLAAGNLFPPGASIRPESRFGESRLDFRVEAGERSALLEVKGVTLAQDGAAVFPDAPTQRGARHIRELIHAVQAGYEAYIVFVITMKGVDRLRPNELTDPAFTEALREAAQRGVKTLALDCAVGADSLVIDRELPVVL